MPTEARISNLRARIAGAHQPGGDRSQVPRLRAELAAVRLERAIRAELSAHDIDAATRHHLAALLYTGGEGR